jgi:hypothetical protein
MMKNFNRAFEDFGFGGGGGLMREFSSPFGNIDKIFNNFSDRNVFF